jgi:filamentous hemagglutinin
VRAAIGSPSEALYGAARGAARSAVSLFNSTIGYTVATPNGEISRAVYSRIPGGTAYINGPMTRAERGGDLIASVALLGAGSSRAVAGLVGEGRVVGYAAPEVFDFTARYLAGSGGRWGGSATRAQNVAISEDLEGLDAAIISGGGRGSEEFIRGTNGGRGTYVDLTARMSDGSTVRVQTVTTMANGALTSGEAAAAARIRSAFPDDTLLTIPKE